MRIKGYPILAIALCALSMLASCDPLSSVEYRVRNMTEDTVLVDMYRQIMTSSYHGYVVEEGDSVVLTVLPEDSIYLATVLPGQCFVARHQWSGLYREELIVPAWRYFKSITVGDTRLDSLWWSNEQSWHLKTEGGRRAEGESRYYDLFLR